MAHPDPHPNLYHPRLWPTWFAFGVLRLLALLPYRPLMAVGRLIGRLMRLLAKRRVHIARVNLQLCFPQYADAQREQLLNDYFEATGMGIMDFAIAWWWPDARLAPMIEIEGEENLKPAFEPGNGVIFYSAHFSPLELSARMLRKHAPLSAMYRPNENPVVEQVLVRNRERYLERTIPRHNVRLMLKTLGGNKGVWFAPDQNYGLKNSVFANFFGVAAATNTSTSRFAAMSGAKVVPFVALRRPEGGYRVIIQPMLEDFPSDSPKQDAERLNQIIEDWVALAPEQYNWMHRRFKDRPGNESGFYE